MAKAKLKPTLFRKFQFECGTPCLQSISNGRMPLSDVFIGDEGYEAKICNPNYYDSIFQISGLKFNIYELSPL